MHFWIDKPTARYCGFRGRRYPAMSFPKTHLGQHRRCGSLDVTRLQMVTPVHRFQTISNSGNLAGPSNFNSVRTRPNNSTNTLVHADVIEQENINNNTNNSSNQQVRRSPNITNRSLLNFSEFSDAEMAGYRLRCSVWIIFVLATGFVAAAKFYFDHQQGAGLEVLIFCGLLVILLISGCFYSLICQRTQNSHQQETQMDSITTVNVANAISNESITQISMPRQNPPPPYHIAILISPPTLADEAPPPAYDKVMQ